MIRSSHRKLLIVAAVPPIVTDVALPSAVPVIVSVASQSTGSGVADAIVGAMPLTVTVCVLSVPPAVVTDTV